MQNVLIGQRYRLAEKIGSGGMADVYKAVDETLGRSVAVKLMHARLSNDPSFTARFQQEAKAAANLQSPYIVNIYDWGSEATTSGQPLYYIVMEHVRGTDLKSVVRQYGALPNKQIAEIGAQVCSALSVAHGYDIIHRDIKPHNIMVLPDGNIKVMDFGIARAGNTTMTQTGSVLGSAHYVSPEQAQGRDLTAVSDLYSLGIVLYEMATGRMPFDGESPVATALKQVQEQAVRPTSLNPGIDPGLEQVIGYAMAKDPRARYATADAMRKDLLRVARGEAIVGAHGSASDDEATRMMGAGAAAGAAMGGRRGPADIDTTTVMPSVDGIDDGIDDYGAGVGGGMGGHRVVNPEPPKKNTNVWIWLLVGLLVLAAAGAIAWQLLGASAEDDVVKMPRVTGMTQELALEKLEEEGIATADPERLITIEEVNHPTIEEGKVISQDPDIGFELIDPENTPVVLEVSLGLEMFEVPELEGLTLEEARELIAEGESDFRLDSTEEFSADVKAGTIISQDPKKGTELAGGETIKVVVSQGVESVQVPSVVGFTKDKAVKTLEDVDLKVVIKEVFDNEARAGVVMDQNPSSPASLPKGGTVTITVSKGPEQVTVPRVVGLSEESARDKLRSLGFEVKIQNVAGELGIVVGQNPAQNARVNKGSTITISVGNTPAPPSDD